MIILFCAEKLHIFFGIKEPSTTWYLAGFETLIEATVVSIIWYLSCSKL